MADKNASNTIASNTVKQTIVANIEAPRLKGVATADFVEFMRERKIYELAIQEKNKDPSTSITPISYKASVERNHLRVFISHKWLSANSVEEVTEENLQDCFKKRATRE